MSVERLMRQLKGFSSPYVYNPWNDFDERYDTNQRASSIRRKQLQAYLEQRLERAKILIIAEAVGYQGGRFTGIAMTCERMLLGHHPTVTPSMVCTGLEPKRTSNPKSEYIIKPIQKEKGFNEPTDSVVWNAMLEANIDPYEVVLWNIFPFHPFKGIDGLTNRTPTKQELDLGWIYTKQLLDLFPQAQIIGVGQKASLTLSDYGIDVQATLRHPANGGAGLYKQQFREFLEEKLKA